MKRLLAITLSYLLVMSFALTSCGNDKEEANNRPLFSVKASPTAKETIRPTETPKVADDPNVKVLKIAAFDDINDGFLKRFKESHPDFPYEMQQVMSRNLDEYEPELENRLQTNAENVPDIFMVDVTYVTKYSKGVMSSYVAAFKDLGIDVDTLVKQAGLMQYTVDIGTSGDGNIVGLCTEASPGAFIYRRSIAQKVWGTDDSNVIQDKIGGSWENFFQAAEELKAKGYGIVSGEGDLWNLVERSADEGWVVDGKLNIDPKREAFLDIAKKLKENGYSNNAQEWTEAWYADMKGTGSKPIFGYFGPEWLISYTIEAQCGGEKAGEGTYGDWAVCKPTTEFFWGGTWVFVNKNTKVPNAVAEVIKWMTLDTSKTGLQYYMANGTLDKTNREKQTVASTTVLAKSNGSMEFLSGQNMFDVFLAASKNIKSKNVTWLDFRINDYWRKNVRDYMFGKVTREQAIANFKKEIGDTSSSNLDIRVE